MPSLSEKNTKFKISIFVCSISENENAVYNSLPWFLFSDNFFLPFAAFCTADAATDLKYTLA